MQPYFLASEQLVDVLQRQIASLGIAEVDERDEEEVEDAEVHIRASSDVGDAHRGDLDHEESEDPIRRRGQSCRSSSNRKRSVLGRHYLISGGQRIGIRDNLQSHATARSPIAKKKLKRKSINVATIPDA